MLIEEIFHKGPVTINQHTNVVEAMKELLSHRFNALLVVDDKEKLVGVLSLQDVAAATVPEQFRDNVFMAHAMYRKGFFAERVTEIKEKEVKDIMRRDFVKVRLDSNIMAVTADFLKNDLYIVPVVEGDEILGVVTRSEIKHALAKELGLEKHASRD